MVKPGTGECGAGDYSSSGWRRPWPALRDPRRASVHSSFCSASTAPTSRSEAQSDPTVAPFAPHPDALAIINGRHTSRGQLNYAVPEALQLQRRIRRCNADSGIQHGDIVALSLDIFLRANGYLPDLAPSGEDAS
ncbi:hypothetical protein [Streptomyces sp. NPDC001530]|uniref:hypothetical protein n=1 Tax=Streptomyces sp. NPDC001530 TaxID=3364582 RepID=UPI003685C0AA